MIHTQFEPRDARRLLPCFDDPHFKAVFELTLTYPKGYTALSNTRPRKMLATNESLVSTTFQRTPRMSTYLLAFAIGKLASAADFTSGKEIRVWGWEEMGGSLEFAAKISGKCLSAMENYTGIPYALDKLDILARNGLGSAMENWGLIIAGYSRLYSDAKSGSLTVDIDDGLAQAEILLHPLVHTKDDFDYVYDAGAAILATVEAVFSKDAFRDALRSYLRAHRFGNACYRDLVAALQTQYAQVGLGHCTGVVNLTAFLDSWFLQPGVPLIDVVADPYGSGYSLAQQPLTNRSELPAGYDYNWIIPLRDGGSGERLWILPG